MVDLKIPSILILVWDLKRTIEKQRTLREGLNSFEKRQLKDPFFLNFCKWYQIYNKSTQSTQNIELVKEFENIFNPSQHIVIHLIEMNLNQGFSIYEQLVAIESQFIETCEYDIAVHVGRLPIIMQIPLLLLIFPAIIMVLIIPVLMQLSF